MLAIVLGFIFSLFSLFFLIVYCSFVFFIIYPLYVSGKVITDEDKSPNVYKGSFFLEYLFNILKNFMWLSL